MAALALAFGVMVSVGYSVTSHREVAELDRRILATFAAIRRPWLNTVAIDLTALGSLTLIAFFTFGGFALLLTSGGRRGALPLLAASAGTAVLSMLAKAWAERPRSEAGCLGAV